MDQESCAASWQTDPHNGGHRGAVDGEMFNPYSSPVDPSFYFHHAWLGMG